MSDELDSAPLSQEPESLDLHDDNDEYEEIAVDEVDRVVGTLEELLESVQSENIQMYLEQAMNSIFYLVYQDEIEDGGIPEAA